MQNVNDLVWCEKYRPKTIEDCVLPKHLKKIFHEFVAQKKFPNLILSGKPGTGKTTVAKALCNELQFDFIVINGSLQRGLDVLRVDIQNYASTLSLSGNHKVVILDEADYLTSLMQPALRNFMEEFSSTCSFIMTCNNKKRIIEPLHSRCSVIDFVIPKDEKKGLIAQFAKRVFDILEKEKVPYEKSAVVNFILKVFPDNRKTLNELQAYSASGQIDEGILSLGKSSTDELVEILKTKNFTDMKNWVAENLDDANTLFREIYDGLYTHVDKSNIPQAVLILADYQYKNAFVADEEINVVACLTELMHEVF